MNWLLSAVLCALLVEIAVRLPFSANIAGVNRSGRRALRAVRSNSVSDHWKEKAMLAYAGMMFSCSLKLAGWLLFLGAGAVLLIITFDQISRGFSSFIVSWQGIGLSIVFASLYLAVRKLLIHARL